MSSPIRRHGPSDAAMTSSERLVIESGTEIPTQCGSRIGASAATHVRALAVVRL
jgi:hypothetical protein